MSEDEKRKQEDRSKFMTMGKVLEAILASFCEVGYSFLESEGFNDKQITDEIKNILDFGDFQSAEKLILVGMAFHVRLSAGIDTVENIDSVEDIIREVTKGDER